MAITSTPTSYYEYRKHQGYIDLVNDTLKAALLESGCTLDKNKHKAFTAPEWVADSFYSEGDTVVPTQSTGGTGFIMKCIDHGTGTEGSSGSTEPNWPLNETNPFGNTVADGDLVWEVWSYHVAEEELSSAGGYVQDALTQDDSDSGPVEDENGNLAYVAYDDLIFEADSTGDFDETEACVFYDDSDPQKTVIALIDFGTQYTITSGNNITLKSPRIESEAQETTI